MDKHCRRQISLCSQFLSPFRMYLDHKLLSKSRFLDHFHFTSRATTTMSSLSRSKQVYIQLTTQLLWKSVLPRCLQPNKWPKSNQIYWMSFISASNRLFHFNIRLRRLGLNSLNTLCRRKLNRARVESISSKWHREVSSNRHAAIQTLITMQAL